MRAFLLIVAVLAAEPAWGKGSLVIVGGGLSPDNAEIYRAFIDRADGGSIAIIPSASGEPQASLDAFAANLVRHGVAASRIVQVRLAEIDDPATPVNEAGWADNARDMIEITKIKAASGIWFTGGDQARTMRLLTHGRQDTPMLAAIRKRLKMGAVVGGTSAGAAIMGSGMIVCGDPKRAKEPLGKSSADCAQQEGQSEPLVLGRGLGFLPNHVIDQHFSQRGRLLRLVRAQACGAGHGIGIDEDTAIVVDLARRRAHVIGSGRVTQIESPRPRNDCVYPTGMMDIVIAKAGQSFGIAK